MGGDHQQPIRRTKMREKMEGEKRGKTAIVGEG
jgi:hypothetical protein